MDSACAEVAAQAHARLRSLLRCRQFFSTPLLVQLYKSHILSFVESSTPAVYHAPNFFLSQIDRVQEVFLEELGISSDAALIEFNLAPLPVRRDIAMMGLLHRIAHNRAPPQFSKLVRLAAHEPFPRCLRPGGRHSMQFIDILDGTHSKMMGRSCLRLIYGWNMLPAALVDTKSASSFQRVLQQAVKRAAKSGLANWTSLLLHGARSMTLATYHSWFDNSIGG